MKAKEAETLKQSVPLRKARLKSVSPFLACFGLDLDWTGQSRLDAEVLGRASLPCAVLDPECGSSRSAGARTEIWGAGGSEQQCRARIAKLGWGCTPSLARTPRLLGLAQEPPSPAGTDRIYFSC